MQTSSSTIRALDRKLVPLFSDLLLHDMGSLGDGIAQGTASPAEMKTAPLWGLRARTPLLHDGRAPTIDAAIRLHDGEAARVRDRYTSEFCTAAATARLPQVDLSAASALSRLTAGVATHIECSPPCEAHHNLAGA